MAVTTTDGTAWTWADLDQKFGPALVAFARRKGADAPEDVAQDVLLAAVEKLGDFDGSDAALRSWLFTVAFRRVADSHRRSHRRPELLAGDQEPVAIVVDPTEDVAVDRCEVRRALAAFELLSAREREVLQLRIVREESPAQVGAELGLRSGNVRVIQARALAKVREHLQSHNGLVVPGIGLVGGLGSKLPTDGALGRWVGEIRTAADAGVLDTEPIVAGATGAAAGSAAVAVGAGEVGGMSLFSALGLAGGAAKLGIAAAVAAGGVAAVPFVLDHRDRGPAPEEVATAEPIAPRVAVSEPTPPVTLAPAPTTSLPSIGASDDGSSPEPSAPALSGGTESPGGGGPALGDQVTTPAREGVVDPLLDPLVEETLDPVVDPLVGDVVDPLLEDVAVPITERLLGPVFESLGGPTGTTLPDDDGDGDDGGGLGLGGLLGG